MAAIFDFRRVWVGIMAAIILTGGPAFAETTLETAKRTGKITIALYNQAPWGYRAADGAISGQAVDVLKSALTALGIKEFTPVISEFSALIPGLLAGRFDAVGAGLYITPERCKLVIFGDPDIKMGDGLLVKAGNPHHIARYEDIAANPELKLGTSRGTIQAQSALSAGVPAERQLLFPDNPSALAALISGRVDAVSGTAASIVGMLADARKAGFDRASPFQGIRDPQGNEKFGYPGLAFRPDDTDFRDAYNAELKKMKADGRLLAINARYGFSESDMPGDKTAQSLCSP